MSIRKVKSCVPSSSPHQVLLRLRYILAACMEHIKAVHRALHNIPILNRLRMFPAFYLVAFDWYLPLLAPSSHMACRTTRPSLTCGLRHCTMCCLVFFPSSPCAWNPAKLDTGFYATCLSMVAIWVLFSLCFVAIEFAAPHAPRHCRPCS